MTFYYFDNLDPLDFSNLFFYSYENRPLNTLITYILDPTIVQALIPWKLSLEEVSNRHLGYADLDLSTSDCRSGECNLGSLVADSMVSTFIPLAQPGHWTYGAIALMPVGDIRGSISKGGMDIVESVNSSSTSHYFFFYQKSYTPTCLTCCLLRTFWNVSSCEVTTF